MDRIIDRWPVIFTHECPVFGNGYLAKVRICGRILASAEAEDEFCIYGVNPGAIAATGETMVEALADFRTRLTAVLFDFAKEASSFDEFRGAVQGFVYSTDEEEREAWDAAVEAVRANHVQAEDLGLGETRPATTPVHVEVTIIAQPDFSPTVNVLAPEPALAA